MTYKGRYKVKNIAKYKGNHKEVVYRSSWERAVFRFLDGHNNITEWSSEEYVIPYRCATDKKVHRYFVDIYFKDSNGQKWLVEIKPKKQTVPPAKPKRKTKRYLNEVLTYMKNESKWKAANAWCLDRGYKFAIWHEDTLKGLGIKILKG
ncbi:MAG: head completion protein [Euryarchaeota archaeon]|mgnify:FL=1|nr:head completion protein [Euryarchaeota archaeon]|tara:strand:+ start:31477 stop:31923 length:447 start_codon:yes stop_codon:yes gene_type:complete